jgi:hypothetical protein
MLTALARPAIAVALVAGLAWAGSRAETYDLDTAFHCTKELSRAKLPPADILFVGNSRTGASIDPVYVERLISKNGKLDVERMGVFHANIVTVRMLVGDYLQYRGTPKLVVLQPMVTYAEHWQQASGRPIQTMVNTAFQPWDELVKIQDSAVTASLPHGMPQWSPVGYRTKPAMFVERVGQQVSAGLRYFHNSQTVEYCRTEGLQGQLPGWPHGKLPASGDNLLVRSNPERMPEKWAAEFRHWDKPAPDHPSRRFEIDQHMRLIEEIERAGSQVMLIDLPTNLGRDADRKDLEAFERALGRPVLDSYALLSRDEQAALTGQYRDPLHVSWEGAEVMSRRLAGAVEDRVRR